MANHATVTNSVLPTSLTQAALKLLIQEPPTPGGVGVPVPTDWLQAFGLRVESDTTTAASPCVRTTEFDFGPSAAATVTANMNAGNTEVTGFTVTGAGLDYILPPVITLAGGAPAPAPGGTPQVLQQAKGRAFLKVADKTIVSGGTSYGASTVIAFVGGLPPALFLNPQAGSNKYSQKTVAPAANGPPYCVQEITVTKQGRNYPVNTQVRFVGGILGTGGIIAQAVVSAFGPNGQILAVQIIDPGFNYITPPTIAFFDPTNPTTEIQTGFEAKAAVSMAAGTPARATLGFAMGGVINAVTFTVNGDGYVQLPNVVVFDPSGVGSGAVIVPRMGVSRVDLLYPGFGYNSTSAAPVVTPVPFFKSLFPDTSDQTLPFWNVLKNAIQQAASTQDVFVSVVLS